MVFLLVMLLVVIVVGIVLGSVNIIGGVGQWLCGSVGRAVASDTRGPRFESSHRQKFILNICFLSTVY